MVKHPKFTIKQILKNHWSNFVSSHSEFEIGSVVFKEVNKVIYCGDFSQGHALYQCNHCGAVLHVPFRCKSRFCNTCGMQYVNDRAFNFSKKLIKCKHRHLVFTIPAELRLFFVKTVLYSISFFMLFLNPFFLGLLLKIKKNVSLLVSFPLYIHLAVTLNGTPIFIPSLLKVHLAILLFGVTLNIFLIVCLGAVFKPFYLIL